MLFIGVRWYSAKKRADIMTANHPRLKIHRNRDWKQRRNMLEVLIPTFLRRLNQAQNCRISILYWEDKEKIGLVGGLRLILLPRITDWLPKPEQAVFSEGFEQGAVLLLFPPNNKSNKNAKTKMHKGMSTIRNPPWYLSRRRETFS